MGEEVRGGVGVGGKSVHSALAFLHNDTSSFRTHSTVTPPFPAHEAVWCVELLLALIL